MKIFKVTFFPVYPVPCGLVIAARNWHEADEIASKTINHTKDYQMTEVDISESKVIFYESGEY